MMKKLTAMSGAALLLTSSLFAHESKSPKLSDEKIFAETIKNVDTGGRMLQFYNTQQLAKQIEYIFNIVQKATTMQFATMPPGQQQQIAMGFKTFDQFLDAAGIDYFKSYAISEKLAEDGMFISKSFAYTTNDAHGLLFQIAKTNAPFDYLKNVPKDSTLALGVHINALELYNAFKAETLKSENPMVKGLPIMAEKGFNDETGKFLVDLLKSASGEYQLIIKADLVNNEPVAKGMIIIPNKNNYLGEFLKEKLDEAVSNNDGVLKSKEGLYTFVHQPGVPAWMKPQLTILKDKIIFSTDSKFEAKCLENKDADYATTIIDGLTVDRVNGGLGYGIVSIDKNLATKIKALIDPSITKMFSKELNEINDLKLYTLDYRLKNGYKSVTKCNFELYQFQTIANILPSIGMTSGMLLPALGAARDQARMIQAMNEAQMPKKGRDNSNMK